MRVAILQGKWKYEFYINSNNIISSENQDYNNEYEEIHAQSIYIHIFHK